MKRKLNSIVPAIGLCLILIAAYILPVLAEPQAVSSVGSWADEIPAMLNAGNYVEGEAVVGVLVSGGSAPGNDLLQESKQVIAVKGSALEATVKTVARSDEIDIVSIQRADMTTEEILYRLAEKPNVVFAEPNYLIDSETASDEDPAEDFDTDADPDSDSATVSDTDPDPAHEITEEPFEENRAETPEKIIEETEETPEASENSAAEKIAGKPVSEMQSPSVRISDIADLTPQQWGSWDGSDYIIKGQNGHSIHVPNFEKQTGNMEGDPVVVAVMDNALDFTNPDLAPTAYTFTEEQQKILGCDVHGFNAASESVDGILTYYPDKSHGTHCAGIIGAAWDGNGISGVASNVKLVSIQHSVENGCTSLVNVLRGFDFIDRANEQGCGSGYEQIL